ncbi:MAG: DUF4411 family protein [Candidatus Saccharibacteria bacterium]|nr:DUF4411 family protein [Candidatus Saccharibacteria bacterium]MCY4088832.1 DUF4411 family protein [Candidatus Saccharibacteria bacterium]
MRSYLIDANILIYFANFCPHDYHKNFWQDLRDKIEKGQIVLIDSIANECKYPSRLKEWITDLRKQKLIKAVNENIIDQAQEINKRFKMITKDNVGNSRSIADTHMIAYAQEYSLSILSYESRRRKDQPQMKIPDVCLKLNIDCKRYPLDIMKEVEFIHCS